MQSARRRFFKPASPQRSLSRARRLRILLSSLLAVVLFIPVAQPAFADEDNPFSKVTMNFVKIATPDAATSALIPGQAVTFTFGVACSSLDTDCIGLEINDVIPAPLVIQGVDDYNDVDTPYEWSIDPATNSFRVKSTVQLDAGRVGLQAGRGFEFNVTATVPTDLDVKWNDKTVTNTAYMTVENVDSNLEDSADVKFAVVNTPKASIAKSVTRDGDPITGTIAGITGRTVDFDIVATNASNGAVDELVVQDPLDPVEDPFHFLDVTGLSGVVFPEGADRVRVDYYAGSAWVNGSASATAALPSGVDPATIKGLRFTFTSSDPATRIARGAEAKLTIETVLNSEVGTIAANETVHNVASTKVTSGSLFHTAQDDATVTIRKANVAVETVKAFSQSSVIGGRDVDVALTTTNTGDFSAKSLTVVEPKAGEKNLREQGIPFSGWILPVDDDNDGTYEVLGTEWPAGATSVAVEYLYDGESDYAAAKSSTDEAGNPMPQPDAGQVVVGFRVTFEGTMAPSEYASLPFTVTSNAVVNDLTTTNHVHAVLTTVDNLTATDDGTAELTRRTARVNTTTTKSILPAAIYASTGAGVLISLPSKVDDLPVGKNDAGGSTVGATEFKITDNDPQFWNNFDLTGVVSTGIPSNSVLTIKYYDPSVADADATGWVVLPGAENLTNSSKFSLAVAAADRAKMAGIQFVYTPRSPAVELPPGFEVVPNFRVALRENVRGTSTPVTVPVRVDPSDPVPANVIIDNDSSSWVTNPVASPVSADDTGSDNVALRYVDAGEGAPLLSKDWGTVIGSSPAAPDVNARSGEQVPVTLSWGTGGVSYESIVVTEPSDPTVAVEETVFDAFNLTQIRAITPASDPLIKYDTIESVELYIGGQWVPTATNPCASNACEGKFPGYTLNVLTEVPVATGARLVFVERAGRATRDADDASAPQAGSGVAPAVDLDRRISYVFQVRDTRRSAPTVAALGAIRGTVYNVPGAPGTVRNDTRVDAYNGTTLADSDDASDEILILDSDINVEATKAWASNAPLGVPPVETGTPAVATPASIYPVTNFTVTATNTSSTRVDEMSITEPTIPADPADATDPFNYLNIVRIYGANQPTGADTTKTVVKLLPASSYPSSYTLAQAQALTEAQLANATGIEVTYKGRIDVGAVARVSVDARLRATERGNGDVITAAIGDIKNSVTTRVVDPGGISGAATSINTKTAVATDSIPLESYTHSVTPSKTIAADTTSNGSSSAIQYDNGSAGKAVVTLSGQPGGTARANKLVIEDSSATFWNAYNFTDFPAAANAPVSPINRVEVEALVGVTYVSTTSPSTLTALCNGDTDLEPCWVGDGTRNATLTMPALGAGKTLADIRGLRFTYTKSDFSQWEHPYNPNQQVKFTVQRRNMLVEPSTRRVPSTLYVYSTPAPGETLKGVFTNTVTVTASSSISQSDPTPLWSDTETSTAAIRYQHLPARVEIKKSPFGELSLAADIPYEIAVRNTGGAGDRDLTGLVVTDLIPEDASGPMLVIETDPDTGLPLANSEIFSYKVTSPSGATLAAPSVTANVGAATGTGQPITFTIAGTLAKGNTLTISAKLRFRPQLTASTPVTNIATVVSDRAFDTCDGYTDAATSKPQLSNVADCSSDTTVRPLPSAPMTIVKGVRGVEAGPLDADGNPLLDSNGDPFDDLGILKTISNSTNPTDCSVPQVPVGSNNYYRYPCVPITRPGSTEEWASKFTNSGNVPVEKIVAIDVLPTGNDRGVIINEARSSKWTPTLTTYPTITGISGYAGATFDVFYVTDAGVATARCNGADIQKEMGMSATTNPPMVAAYQACLPNTGKADDLPNRNWKLLDPSASQSLLADIVALKFVIKVPGGLAPGSSAGIIYQSTTAFVTDIAETATGLARDSIAYNSIAGAAVGINGVNDLPYRFVVEPRKVGVAMATGQIELNKAVTGSAASFATNSFKVDVACTSGGEPIALKNADGTLRSPFTLVGNGPTVTVLGIPLYSECEITEGSYGQGAGSTITPSTVTAQAGHTTASNVYDANPAFDDPATPTVSLRPSIERATITNEYLEAGFSVSKVLDTNSLKNQLGTNISWNTFSFTAVCSFDNGDGIATNNQVLNQSFTLNGGGTRVFNDLPAGSSCTVTETGRKSATATTYELTVDGTTTTGTTASTFVLAADSAPDTHVNAIEFTNTYGVGSLDLTKAVTGLGGTAYGTGTFTVGVNCVHPTSVPSVTWNQSFTFSKATGLTATIDRIAAGSVCTVTETAANDGGATARTATQNVTIAADVDRAATVTNRFDLARLEVRKVVTSGAVNQDGETVYPGGSFQMTVDCTFEGNPVYATGFSSASPMVFSLTYPGAGDRRTLTGLPAGASCSITEATPPGADSTTIHTASATANGTTTGLTRTMVLTPDSSTTVGTNLATVTNRYDTSAFTITKELKGGGATQFGTGEFIVHVTCIAPGDITAYDDDIVLTAEEPEVTVEDIPDNSVCEAEETNFAATGADASVWRDADGDVFDGTGVAVTNEEPGAATLENWYLTGSLTVTKVVDGLGSAFGTGPFEVTLDCSRTVGTTTVDVNIPGGATRALGPLSPGAAMTATYTMLPRGASCTLTETDTGSATSSLIANASGTTVAADVADGYTFTVAVDNTSLTDNQTQPALTVKNTFALASLDVTKRVESLTSDVEYGPFDLTVDCVFEGRAVYGTGYSDLTPMAETLERDDTWSIAGLPSGAVCTVEEPDSMDAVETTIVTTSGTVEHAPVTGTTATLTLASDPDGNSAEVTNRYDIGGIVLSKALAGDAKEEWGDKQFTIDVTCELTDATGTRIVWLETYTFEQGDPAVTIPNIAAGAECTFTESKTGGATSTTVSIDGTPEPGTTATLVVPASNTPVEVVVTNTFDFSVIEVSKVRDGDGASLYGAGPFEVSLSCERDIDGVMETIVIPGTGLTPQLRTLSAISSYKATYEGLPSGAVCELEETISGGADATEISPAGKFTVGATATLATITNTFDVGEIALTKAFAGEGAWLYGNGPFVVEATCSRVVNGDTIVVDIPGGKSRELTALNGYRASFTDLPSRALCSLVETTTGGATSTSIDTPNVTVVADEAVPVTITNTYEIGTLMLQKQVIGTGAKAHTKETFKVALACEMPIDGVITSIPIPGGAERPISAGDVVVYDNLPKSAACAIDETTDGGAVAMILSRNGIPLVAPAVSVNADAAELDMANVFMATPPGIGGGGSGDTSSLAITGAELLPWAILAALLSLLGVGLLLTARPRRARHSA